MLIIGLIALSFMPLTALSATTYASPAPPSEGDTTNTAPPASGAKGQVVCPDGHTVVASNKVDTCPDTADPAVTGGNCSKVTSGSCDLVSKYIQPAIDLLAGGVGIAVVISIVIGGMQYSSSAGDSSKITAAKNRIRNSIIALVMFLFLVAFLNFLIPGGIV